MAFWPTPPVVLTTPGPAWATGVNTFLNLLPFHSHSGTGETRIPVAGLNINADLPFTANGVYYAPTLAAAYGYHPAALPTAGTRLSSTYIRNSPNANGDLYFRDASGTDIPITANGAIVPTGTGAYQGFYGNYANGSPASSATAYYRTSTAGYEFYSSIASQTPVNYNALANIKAGGFAAYPGAAYSFVSFDPGYTFIGGNLTPTGGWSLRGVGAFKLSFDGTDSTGVPNSLYANTALTVNPKTVNNEPFQFRLGFNLPDGGGLAGGFPVAPLDIATYGTFGVFSPNTVAAWRSYNSFGVGNGYGLRHTYSAPVTSWAGYGVAPPAVSIMGTTDAYWADVTNRGGGIHLHGAWGGTVSTSGLYVTALDNSALDFVGMGVAPSTAYRLTVNGGAAAAASFTGNVSAVGSLNVTGTGAFSSDVSSGGNLTAVNATISTNLNVGTSSTVTGTSSAQNFMPSLAAPGNIGIHGRIYKNNTILAHATVNGTTGAVGPNFNITTGGRTGTGSYNVVFDSAFTNSSYLVFVQVDGIQALNKTSAKTTTGFTVNTYDLSNALQDYTFDVIVVGLP